MEVNRWISNLGSTIFTSIPPPRYWRKPPMDCGLAILGPKKILFGTDYPLGSDFLARGVAMVEGCQLDGPIRRSILFGNARNFWKV
jgi:predicted TIM-barrel fold metal-dependent hydrolase